MVLERSWMVLERSVTIDMFYVQFKNFQNLKISPRQTGKLHYIPLLLCHHLSRVYRWIKSKTSLPSIKHSGVLWSEGKTLHNIPTVLISAKTRK